MGFRQTGALRAVNCTFDRNYIAVYVGVAVEVRNSIFSNNNRAIEASSCTRLTIESSTFWTNDFNLFPGGSSSTEVPGAGNEYLDPQYVGATDLRLSASSPCIDSGVAAGAPDHDFAFVARPQDGNLIPDTDGSTFNREAYEFVANGSGGDGAGGSGGAGGEGSMDGAGTGNTGGSGGANDDTGGGGGRFSAGGAEALGGSAGRMGSGGVGTASGGAGSGSAAGASEERSQLQLSSSRPEASRQRCVAHRVRARRVGRIPEAADVKTRSFASPVHVVRHFFFTLAVVELATLGIGCSSRGSNNGTGGSSGSDGDAPYRPCPESVRTGAFSLELKPADVGNTAYSQVTGGVRDGVFPRTVWVKESVNGSGNECQLMVGPASACSPACTSPQICRGSTCQNPPVSKSVGEVTFTGLVIPVMMTPTITGTGSVVYSGLIPSDTAFPPYAVGAALELMAAGADYPAFMLSGRGIQPLEAVAGQTLDVAEDQPLMLKWMTAQVGAGRIKLSMDIGHHGGVAAELHCDDLPDTGSVTIPAPLITALMNKGTSGFPTVSLTRVSIDSTTVGPGCVEFNVASAVELTLNVAGVRSCHEDAACTPPEICRPAGVPNGLSCGMP